MENPHPRGFYTSSLTSPTVPPRSHPRRDSPTFTARSISDDTWIRSKTLLHVLIQQRRVWIFWNGRYRVFAGALDLRLLGRSTTWNAASVGLCRVQLGGRSFLSASALSTLPRTHARSQTAVGESLVRLDTSESLDRVWIMLHEIN
jgi:hypothetical protein